MHEGYSIRAKKKSMSICTAYSRLKISDQKKLFAELVCSLSPPEMCWRTYSYVSAYVNPKRLLKTRRYIYIGRQLRLLE